MTEEQNTVQYIKVDIEDMKSALLAQTDLIIALIEKIVESGKDLPMDIGILAATLGSNLGLSIISDEMIAEMIAFSGPGNNGQPKKTTVWVEDGTSNFEQVLHIMNSGDVKEEDLDPPSAEAIPEGTMVED